MSERKRYIVVGTGSRGLHMFAEPLLNTYTEFCELVGLCDHNPLRLAAAKEILRTDIAADTDFRRLLRRTNPHAVIVATQDSTHARYIIAALKAGKRVISEKPLCTTARQCARIIAARDRHRSAGAECFVTHNMRYGPSITQLKQLIDDGAVGRILAISFHENLDRRHGADYFRRWHRIKANSGGLQIHKASHHFDTLNWLAGSVPQTLSAQGGLMFYGRNGPVRHTRCMGCPHAGQCELYVDMWQNPRKRRLYLDAEPSDGYVRDGCVFDPAIDIEDQLGVLYTYANGIRVTYSLTAFASYEGWHIQIQGTVGRLELREVHDTRWAGGASVVHGLEQIARQQLALYSFREGLREIPIAREEGTHGGADPAIQRDFFARPFEAPPTPRQAPLEQAVQAVLIGHAVNVSMARGGRQVDVQNLLPQSA